MATSYGDIGVASLVVYTPETEVVRQMSLFRGSRMVPFERALMSSYRPSIVAFPLSLRILEILPLLCSCTPLFPTLPLVSPKFPHVPLGVGGWPLEFEERTCSANCSYNSKISNLCGPDLPTSQTDRRTERHTTCNRNTALCTSRGKKIINWTELKFHFGRLLKFTKFPENIKNFTHHFHILHFQSTNSHTQLWSYDYVLSIKAS